MSHINLLPAADLSVDVLHEYGCRTQFSRHGTLSRLELGRVLWPLVVFKSLSHEGFSLASVSHDATPGALVYPNICNVEIVICTWLIERRHIGIS